MPRQRAAAMATCLLAALLAAPWWAGAAEVAFDAGFEPRNGNEWWIQAKVTANAPVASVDARVDGGPWLALEKKSWGDWAASHHAEEGSLVQFRASSDGAETDVSGCFRWTAGTPADCGGGGDEGVRFEHGGGNDWWVEAKVRPRPDAVDAMDAGGAWVALELKSWGEWAGSFRIEAGNDVRFRATYPNGTTVQSCWFSHPDGEPRCDAPPPPPPARAPAVAEGSRRLVAMGDTGAGANAQANVQGSLDDHATGFLGLGDYDYDGRPDEWARVFAPLLDMEHHLALGNHDDARALGAYFPNGTSWSVHVAGARIVGIDSTRDMRPGSGQHAFARDALCSAPEPLRVLLAHHPWWLGASARHPGSEFPASPADMDALVEECGVDLVLAAHEHNYQRAMRGEVAYVIVGTGGRSLYEVRGSAPGTEAAVAAYGRLLVDVNASGYVAHFRTLSGETFDSFAGAAEAAYAPPPAQEVVFRHGGGNGWWVEAVVEPAPSGVDARDEGGAWVGLELKDWGEWAASFRIESGNPVQFRARFPNGTLVESCWFTHPDGEPRCGAQPPPPSGFEATFSNVRGNEWWVETDVRASGGTLAGVDARVDGGAWVALELKSWGSWAENVRAPAGSLVEFRARGTQGEAVVSERFAWPP